MHQIKIVGLQALGYRAARAVANCAIIEFSNGRDFGRGSREKGFVGNINLITSQALLDDVQTLVCGELENGLARNAI
jgi:hypothetical protein